MKFGVGQAVPRKEDPRMITGGGRFTADIAVAGALHLSVARSPYAHARIERIDVSAARTVPGVLAVYVAGDLDGLGGLPCRAQLQSADGTPALIPHRPILAEDKVCYVGQPYAAVVAEEAAAAQEAAELIELHAVPLAANVAPAAALDPDTPVIHDAADSNLSVAWEQGDQAAVAAAERNARQIVEIELVNNRVAPTPLEPRACIGLYDEAKGFTLYNPSQGAVAQRQILAAAVLNEPLERVRVISEDTGGGFGIRGEVHAEACVCLFAARALGRPVRWTGTRSEMFLTDAHGRDNVSRARLALDGEGRFLALAIETFANIGAYCNTVGPFVPTMGGGKVVGSVYAIGAVHQTVNCVFTNTAPVGAYRGAGRPEACYLVERLIEKAARSTGRDALELRRRNFITPDALPYQNVFGASITSGAFADTLDLALRRADVAGFPERRNAAAAGGLRLGLGIGYYVEASGGGPEEEATITVRADGEVEVVVGTYSHGQGHRTAFSQIVAETLGVDFERVNVVQGDTDRVPFGGGTGGSRSSQMGGVAVRLGAEQVREQGQALAAEMLQAEVHEVAFEDGAYRRLAPGSDGEGGSVSLAEVARAAESGQFGAQSLAARERYKRAPGWSFPNGCHVAEVCLDPDTGTLTVSRYTAVDDCGRVINPLLAAGQVHGGVAQGAGQALLEGVCYDENGQLVTGSFMDYALPRASHLCDVDVSFHEVLEPTNPLGVKGIGEGGACGAPSALVNAAIDALGGIEIDMPLTPEKVWRALHNLPPR